MKSIKLESLMLSNYRGIKYLEINFHDSVTTITGGNGTGKSTVFNSFLWLLFGKDAQDRKDYNIHPIVDAEPDRRVDATVEAVIRVNEEEITLRRVLRPNWVKPRGQVEQVFKGNVTDTYWNDAPVTVTEYQKRINDIINDSIFKMITNPLFFANMKWQDQREQLFQLAGTITDAEIATQKPEFAALLDSISGKPFADFRKEILARKKRLKEELAQIQPRIDQTSKLMPEIADFAKIESEIAKIDEQIAKIDGQIADKASAIRGQYEAIQGKQSIINDLRSESTRLLYEAQAHANDEANNANANRRDIESNIKSVEREVASLQRSVNMTSSELEQSKTKLEAKKKDVASMRETWFEVNAEEYKAESGVVVCPLLNVACNNAEVQANLEANQEAARSKFNNDKAKKLAQITQNGVDLSNLIKQLEQDINNTSKAFETESNELKTKRDELEMLNKQISETEIVLAKEIKPWDIQECVNITAQIKEIEVAISNLENANPIDTTELQATKRELSAKRDEARKVLSNKDLISTYKSEIEQLESKGKDLAQQLANVEREEFTLQAFSKARVEECERRINGLFSTVKFQLFDYNIDDAKKENPIETCIPLVDGVPFPVANTAGQVNAGLDIINALCRFYCISAPIFIDGRESINTIIDTASQIINLVVTNDNKLQIN